MCRNKNGIHSEECRRKISRTLTGKYLGRIGYMKGKKHSEETKRKISESNKGKIGSWAGKKQPAEMIEKRRLKIIGHIGYWKGKKQPRELVERRSLKLKGNIWGFKKGQVPHNKGKKYSKETRALISKKGKLLWQNPEYRERLVQSHKTLWKNNEEYRENALKKLHSSETREKVFKSIMKSRFAPNNFEQACGIFLSEKLPEFNFRYVGNRAVQIANKFPDFIDYQNKIVVLANGIYWHLIRRRKEYNRFDLEKWEVEAIEKMPYEQAGYKVIFIWEDELYENPEKVLNEIREKLSQMFPFNVTG